MLLYMTDFDTSCGNPDCPYCGTDATQTEEDVIFTEIIDLIDEGLEGAYQAGYSDGARAALDSASLTVDDEEPTVEEFDLAALDVDLDVLFERTKILHTDLLKIFGELNEWAPGVDAALAGVDDVFARTFAFAEAVEAWAKETEIAIALLTENVADVMEGQEARIAELEANAEADAAALDAQGLLLQDVFRRLDDVETALRDEEILV